MEEAHEVLQAFWPRFNASFAISPKEPESRFPPLVPSMKAKLSDILCLRETRTVANDSYASYCGRTLQTPRQPHRCHYVPAKVGVHRYGDGAMVVFHDGRRLARYNAHGRLQDRAAALVFSTVLSGRRNKQSGLSFTFDTVSRGTLRLTGL